jgi:MFS family permease
MGYYGMALAAATLVGYGLGGVIASRLGFRVLFLFGTILLAIGAALSFGLPKDRQAVGMTVASPWGTTFQQLKGLLKRKGLALAYCAIFAQYFTFGGVVTLLPIYVNSLGMEAFHVGMLLAVFAVMFILFQFPSGALSDRLGRIRPTIAGLGLGIVALVLLSSVSTLPLLASAMALYGLAYGLIFPSISALVVDQTLPGERGLATGIFHALLTSGVAIGAPIIGWAGGTVGIESGLALNAGVMALVLIVALATVKRA